MLLSGGLERFLDNLQREAAPLQSGMENKDLKKLGRM